jgi:hypothetical protein
MTLSQLSGAWPPQRVQTGFTPEAADNEPGLDSIGLLLMAQKLLNQIA